MSSLTNRFVDKRKEFDLIDPINDMRAQQNFSMHGKVNFFTSLLFILPDYSHEVPLQQKVIYFVLVFRLEQESTI